MSKKLENLLLEGIQAVATVSPNPFLSSNYQNLVKVLKFIEETPSAAYAEKKLRNLFSILNWVLDAKRLESFFQLMGEVQFWMLAKDRGVALERIPEASINTADLRMKGHSADLPQFEVKTLSVSGGGWINLAQMAEESFQVQHKMQAQRTEGKRFIFGVQSFSPHGAIKHGKEHTQMCINLIDKALGNIKAGQYASAPTFMVLNLMLIDGHFNEAMDLRPVAAGYPEPWSLRTGVLWTTGFGTMGQLIHCHPEFEGKAGIEGFLEREGVLSHPHFKELAGLLMVVHNLSKEPTIYGLMRDEDRTRFENSSPMVLESFQALVGDLWNDELDSNGWRLVEC